MKMTKMRKTIVGIAMAAVLAGAGASVGVELATDQPPMPGAKVAYDSPPIPASAGTPVVAYDSPPIPTAPTTGA